MDLAHVKSVTYYLRDSRKRWISRMTTAKAPFDGSIDWRRAATDGEMIVTAHVLKDDATVLQDPGGWVRVSAFQVNPGGELKVITEAGSTPRAVYTPAKEASQIGSVEMWMRGGNRRWSDAGTAVRDSAGRWQLDFDPPLIAAWGKASALSAHVVYPTGRQKVDPVGWVYNTSGQARGSSNGISPAYNPNPTGRLEAYQRLDTGLGARYETNQEQGIIGVELWLRESSGRWLDAGSASHTGSKWELARLDGSDSPGFSSTGAVVSVHVVRANGHQAVDPAPWVESFQKELVANISITLTPSATQGAKVSLLLTVKNVGRAIGKLGVKFSSGDNWLDHVNGASSANGCARDDSLGAIICGSVGDGENTTFNIIATARDVLVMQVHPVVLDYYSTGAPQPISLADGSSGTLALVESISAAPATAPIQPQPPPPAPVPPPAPPGLTVHITTSVYGHVAASTQPGATCSASATLPSGNTSTAAGLQVSKTAGGDGSVGWSYRTSGNTTRGTGTHTVTCQINGQSASDSAPFTVP
jgi:hypothetical protein